MAIEFIKFVGNKETNQKVTGKFTGSTNVNQYLDLLMYAY